MFSVRLAPSIGADWERTTWLQYSNVVWYVLPSVIVVLLFRRVRKRVRRDAQRAAAVWGERRGAA